jgi:hypothetical protein
MTRHARALASALALVAGTGCGPMLEAEVKNVRITIPDQQLAGVPGSAALGDVEVDVGGELPDGDGWTIEIRLKALGVAWADPGNHPDFSQFTSATLSVIPGPTSMLPPVVVASYVQDPADPDPHEIVIAGDPAVNLHEYLVDGTFLLRIEAQGSTPSSPWTASAWITADLGLRVEYSP